MDNPRGRGWSLLVAAIALLPVLGLFTTTRIYFVRDLSFFFWSRHLWMRHTIFSGQAPWWDPFIAAGQSAIADALNQLLMPVTLAIRLLPSEVVSFNLWVALPLPIAAVGMFAFLRRRVPNVAAALGACVFALSGPVVSSLNTPNLSWSVALLPWVFRAVDTGGPALAVAFALQALCGEPVTWVATGVLVGCWILTEKIGLLDKLRLFASLAAGALLAAAQLVPTLLAGVRAHRAAIATPDFWSLHPATLWEAVAPNLFGNYYDAFLADLPWMGALNFGRDPFFYSLYVGPLVLVLAAVALLHTPRRSMFWGIVAFTAIVFALGGYTPVYPLLRKLVPPLMYFRFPVKYIVFAVFALACLAAEATARLPLPRQALSSIAVPVAVVAVLGLVIAMGSLAATDLVTQITYKIAIGTHLKDPSAGAAFLARTAPPLAARFFGLLLAGSVLIVAASRGRSIVVLLFLAVAADLTITNAPLNFTLPVDRLSPPAWYGASAGPQRIYIGGRARGYMNGGDPDGVSTWQIPAESTAIEGRMELNAQLPMMPSGWGVREALSYDLPYLWPADYEATLRRFEDANPEQRDAFLRRSAVSRCVYPDKDPRPFPVVADVSDWNMRVFECNAAASRAYLASSVAVAPDPKDLAWQRDGLFDVSLGDDDVRVERAPAKVGVAGTSGADAVRIALDRGNEVIVDATLRHDGVLVLRDSYDPSWHATVDGMAAEIVRANGRYRAVGLPAGHHVVRFTYRPRDFIMGLIISIVTGLALTAVAVRRPRRPARAAGFTLIELMIVLAVIGILLAIAFTEYRGMQARGNEASAMGSLRSIATAQWQFATTCANGKYASTLPALAQPVPATGHGFLSPDLTSAESFEKSGYLFEMAAKALDAAPPACNGAAVSEGYAVTADPARPGLTGTRFFGINADRILYSDEAQTFKENLPESGAANHGSEVR